MDLYFILKVIINGMLEPIYTGPEEPFVNFYEICRLAVKYNYTHTHYTNGSIFIYYFDLDFSLMIYLGDCSMLTELFF